MGRKVLFSAVSLLIAALLVELLARTWYFQTTAERPFAVLLLYQRLDRWWAERFKPESGIPLNQRAWEATYRERDLPVPPQGPREGYWGSRLSSKIGDRHLGWHEPETHLPSLVEVDADGYQYAGRRAPASTELLVLGGSVAFGAYASAIDRTYFVRLADRLEDAGHPIALTLLASSAWFSSNELVALLLRGVPLRPDVVLFLDGLNDLTQNTAVPFARRTPVYLQHMRQARDLALLEGIVPVFALQPFLTAKRNPSELETLILRQSSGSPAIGEELARMRAGLEEIAAVEGAWFVDCSAPFDEEEATTFSDLWHFSDPGHELLAGCLARGLEEILPQVKPPPSAP